MSKKLRIGCSPLTGTIYAGTLLKDGITWGANKQDVTMDALLAVIGHVQAFEKPVEIYRVEGEKKVLDFTITVKKH